MKVNCLIIGAGLSGLSTAYHLNKSYLIYEKESRVGGLCRTEEEKGYFFDLTGHLLHLRDEYMKIMVDSLIGDQLTRIDRNAWVFSQNCFTRYPYQSNTYGLPLPTVKECLVGFFNALVDQKMGLHQTAPENFEEWIMRTFGEGIARHFMIPYNTKLWTVPPAEMSCDWMSRFVPQPDLEDVIEGALRDKSSVLGYNANFLYPAERGIQVLPNALARHIRHLKLNAHLEYIDLTKRQATFSNGDEVEYDRLVSTIPLPELLRKIEPLPHNINELLPKLRCASVYNINYGLKKAPISDKHWIYVPEEKYPFYRIGYISNFSKEMVPPDCQSIYTEVSYSSDRPIDKESVIAEVIDGLLELGVITDRNQVDLIKIIDIPYGYVIYDRHYADVVPKIHNFLISNGIDSIGRYGKWVYNSMEDALIDGKKTAEKINSSRNE